MRTDAVDPGALSARRRRRMQKRTEATRIERWVREAEANRFVLRRRNAIPVWARFLNRTKPEPRLSGADFPSRSWRNLYEKEQTK